MESDWRGLLRLPRFASNIHRRAHAGGLWGPRTAQPSNLPWRYRVALAACVVRIVVSSRRLRPRRPARPRRPSHPQFLPRSSCSTTRVAGAPATGVVEHEDRGRNWGWLGLLGLAGLLGLRRREDTTIRTTHAASATR